MLVDQVVYLQVKFCRLFMLRHKLTPKQFVSLNMEKDIVGYLREGYEPFHLTGDDGVLEELDNYVYG